MASLEAHLSALLDSYRDNNAEWYPYTARSDGWFSAIVGGTQRKLREALASVPKTRVRTISFDVWMDANKGIEKTYDESGDEITDSAAEG